MVRFHLHPFYPNRVGAYMFMNYPQRLRLQRILDSVSQGRHAAGSIEQMVGDFTHRVWIL
jgi:putative endopeptidase